ncbi:SDR family oxidoreductase [Trebonia kvetii]|uniref:SDR family oxidoreductase n=1 Tax=Trebonia kvetii TaxID=2480626 RepID=A0A6P2BPV6_9ACTN|nr:SDR family oxidoreductase [Trebonia kvetii]TVZ01139.1 SDR family oxidoreductase [Trebonia kvetii]
MSVVDDLFSVRGKVALVTGGASGLGYAFAEILVQAGANVVIADWDNDALEKAVRSLGEAGLAAGREPPHRGVSETGGMKGPPLVSGRGADVSYPRAVSELVDRVVATHGKIDIVFANAGIARGRPPLLPAGWLDDMDMAAYKALIDVNLHGVVYTVQAAARHMKKQRSGSIVTTASTAGMRNDPYTPYSYAIAKAAVVNFTKQAAHDLARWGVRVNAIAPGPFKTHLGGKEPTSAEADAMWSAVVPLGRMGDPKEIRGLALLLASDAGSFMTGGIYPIDGGALLQGPSLPPPD